VACFHYDKDVFEKGSRTIKDYFLSYPIIKINAQDADGKDTTIDWYPSEYLYREASNKMYCLAADKNSDSSQILFGSTIMRQYQWVFDVANERIGAARRACNEDPHMIMSQQDYVAAGKTFGLQAGQQSGVAGRTSAPSAALFNRVAPDARPDAEYLAPCTHSGAKAKSHY